MPKEPLERHYDILVIGGAIMGSALAYWLTRITENGLTVLVCERDPTYACSATMAAAGGIRQTFSSPENIAMSRFSAGFLRHAADTLAVDGEAVDPGFIPRPYLFLAGDAGDADRLRAVHAARAEAGAPSHWLETAELDATYPWLFCDDLLGGLLGGPDEGTFDSHALLRGFKRKAIAGGAQFCDQDVVALERSGCRISSVRLASGIRVNCGALVVAAGGSSGKVLAQLGISLPIASLPVASFLFSAATPPPVSGNAVMPIIVDRSQGLNVKPEGGAFLCAMRGATTSTSFDTLVWPALAHRIPAFEASRFAGIWESAIDASSHDGNPFIGPFSTHPDVFVIAGFNGHGLQHAPAACLALAERIVHGTWRSFDLSRFSPERIDQGLRATEHF